MLKNISASCETCSYRDGSKPKNCKQCSKKDGRPGWDPAAGVPIRTGTGFDTRNRQYQWREVMA